jgi:dynein heavy chain 1
MLKRVEPLRDELHSLEVQAQENKNHGEEVKNLIIQLEHSIASYKEEYAQLISQAQAIKTDLENVQAKVWVQDLVPIITDVIRYPVFV